MIIKGYNYYIDKFVLYNVLYWSPTPWACLWDDEIWSFCYAKEKNIAAEMRGHAVAMHFMFYNFGRQSLRVTPAMEAGLTNHVWSLEEIAGDG